MLDTKLKKMRNTKVLIILFTILIPAIVLVALYPRMGQVYNNQIKEIEAADEAANQAAREEAAINNMAAYGLSSNFVNYAMEASYYLYGQMLQEARKTAVDFSMLDYYGWINDYYTLASDCEYYVEYNYIPEDGTPGRMIEKKERPCLNYSMKKCIGPCTGNISKEEYKTYIDEVINIFNSSQTNLNFFACP